MQTMNDDLIMKSAWCIDLKIYPDIPRHTTVCRAISVLEPSEHQEALKSSRSRSNSRKRRDSYNSINNEGVKQSRTLALVLQDIQNHSHSTVLMTDMKKIILHEYIIDIVILGDCMAVARLGSQVSGYHGKDKLWTESVAVGFPCKGKILHLHQDWVYFVTDLQSPTVVAYRMKSGRQDKKIIFLNHPRINRLLIHDDSLFVLTAGKGYFSHYLLRTKKIAQVTSVPSIINDIDRDLTVLWDTSWSCHSQPFIEETQSKTSMNVMQDEKVKAPFSLQYLMICGQNPIGRTLVLLYSPSNLNLHHTISLNSFEYPLYSFTVSLSLGTMVVASPRYSEVDMLVFDDSTAIVEFNNRGSMPTQGDHHISSQESCSRRQSEYSQSIRGNSSKALEEERNEQKYKKYVWNIPDGSRLLISFNTIYRLC